MDERKIVHRMRVQPGLNVAIEDSLNILLEVERPDGSEVIVRSGILANLDALTDALELARIWVVAANDDIESRRLAELREVMNQRRNPRAGSPAVR